MTDKSYRARPSPWVLETSIGTAETWYGVRQTGIFSTGVRPGDIGLDR